MFVTFTIGNRNTCTSKSILVCSSCVPRIINLIPALFPTNWQWPWIFLCLKECYCVSQPNVHNFWVFVLGSPCAHLHVVRMLRFMSARSQPSLPTPFFNWVLVSISVYMARSTVFRSINVTDNSSFSHSVFSGLISALLVLSSMHLFMKVFFSPDIILSGWLGLKHRLAN